LQQQPVAENNNRGGPRKLAEAETIGNPLTRRHQFRSVSSLDVSMEEDDTPKPTLLKEFGGSASSIDFTKSGIYSIG